MTNSLFDKLVAIRLGDAWTAIDNAADACRLLTESWPDKSGPSYIRAIANCRAYLEGDGPMMAARASLVVAAMEAMLPVAVHEDAMAFVEAQVAMVTEMSVRQGGVSDEK
jgi:hypothetical protein